MEKTVWLPGTKSYSLPKLFMRIPKVKVLDMVDKKNYAVLYFTVESLLM